MLVDFWADVVRPVPQLAPTIEEFDEHYGDKVEVVKLDTDANVDTAAR